MTVLSTSCKTTSVRTAASWKLCVFTDNAHLNSATSAMHLQELFTAALLTPAQATSHSVALLSLTALTQLPKLSCWHPVTLLLAFGLVSKAASSNNLILTAQWLLPANSLALMLTTASFTLTLFLLLRLPPQATQCALKEWNPTKKWSAFKRFWRTPEPCSESVRHNTHCGKLTALTCRRNASR